MEQDNGMDEQIERLKKEKRSLRNELVIALRALQIIGLIILLTIIPVFFFPVTIYGLGVGIIIMMLYIRKIENGIKKKNKEEEEK